MTTPMNESIHSRYLEQSGSDWHTMRTTDIEDEDHDYKHSYKSVERDHHLKQQQWTVSRSL